MTEIDVLLRRIGIRADKAALDALLQHATTSRSSPAKTLETLVELELRVRDARNLERRARGATLGAHKTLDQFDWNYPRVIDRDLYESLLALDFIERGENVLLRGPAGVGKTTLAQNLGLRALERGHTVRFVTLPYALADLLRQESIPATERRLKRYTTPNLLILDELGYVPCDGRSADLFFHIISRRHEQRSVVITTNLAFKQWGPMFHNASCVGPLVDRFAQHCHIIDIEADSWRQTHGSPARRKKAASTRVKTTS